MWLKFKVVYDQHNPGDVFNIKEPTLVQRLIDEGKAEPVEVYPVGTEIKKTEPKKEKPKTETKSKSKPKGKKKP